MTSSIHTREYRALLRALVAARDDLGITQQQLADRLSKQQSFVSKYERGERRLDVVEFLGITRALGVDACELLIMIREAGEAG